MLSVLIDLDQFEIIEKIGEGSCSVVYSVQKIETKEYFAAKISKNECKTFQDQHSFFEEIASYSQIQAPSVIKMFGFNLRNFQGEPFPTIIVEYMPNKSLSDLLKNEDDILSSKKYRCYRCFLLLLLLKLIEIICEKIMC